jgi:hypothetical protein
MQLDSTIANERALEPAVQRKHRAARLGVAEVAEHQRVAVDHAGRRRVQRRHAGQLGLERKRLLARHAYDVRYAVRMRLRLDVLQLGHLPRRSGDDQLAAARMGNAVPDAVLVEQLFAAQARPRLQRPLRVVDPGVDDFRVPGAGVGPDRFLRLQDHDLAARERQGTRNCEADDACADDCAIEAIHAARPSTHVRPA